MGRCYNFRSTNTIKITIPTPANFSFSECLWFLDRGFDEVLYHVDHQRVIRPLYFEGEVILIEVSGTDEALSVNILNSDFNKSATEFVSDYVIDWFDLNQNLSPFYELAHRDEILKPVVEDYKGLRLIGIVDMFEALSWSIIGQQINLTFAYKLKRALTERFGHSFEHDGKRHYLFPKPADLVGIASSELLELQFSRQKANYIITLAEAFESGELKKDELLKMPLAQALESLIKIKGIGPWTANYVAMKCLKQPDAFPLQDVGLHNALKARLNRDTKPSQEEILALSENWKGWRAYATLYLWRSLSVKV